ncbi:Transposase [Shigella dysenteriae 1617]|uniref:Transposase n=1 Tax=Shigella dysenteriae 1617 TaxID=754093 RepID=A0A0A7A263_SHIDY|nr:Transposase [Shigella dysenteriae 1617]
MVVSAIASTPQPGTAGTEVAVVLKSVELHDKVSRALSRTIKHYTIS